MGDLGRQLLAARDRVRTSLFVLPGIAVALAAVFGWLSVLLDGQLDGRADLPLVLDSTVESSRTVLQVVAGATIAFAGVAFSVSMLTVQQASAQYSPRVIEAIFRDPFNRRVMALVVGTFTYSLTVLRSVRSSIGDAGDAVVPIISVTIAVVLGVVTILGVVAFIDHNARAMDISTILDRIDRETIRQLEATWSPPGEASSPPPIAGELLVPSLHVVRAVEGGWVQRVDLEALLRCVPAGGTIALHTGPGRFVLVGAPLASLSCEPDDPAACARAVRRGFHVGPARSREQDVTLGLRQLADIALRALSPGVNDPTTARDAMAHAANVLAVALRMEPPPARRSGPEGRELVLLEQPTHGALVHLAWAEVRRSAAHHPAVAIDLLDALAELRASLAAEGRRAPAELVRVEAHELSAAVEASGLPPRDRRAVRECFASRFGSGASPP